MAVMRGTGETVGLLTAPLQVNGSFEWSSGKAEIIQKKHQY